MRALFRMRDGHPLAEARLQKLDGSNLTRRDFENVMRLGVPFRNLDETSAFRVEVAKRIADLNAAVAEPAMPRPRRRNRARIRTDVANEFFRAGTPTIRSMPGSWPVRSPRIHGPVPRPSPGMT